jgi:tetratricopeptide (TPR) repeat protein
LQVTALVEANKHVEAEQTCRAAVKDFEAHAGEHPNDSGYRLDWFRCRNQLAELQTQMYKFHEAKECLTTTLAALKQFSAAEPKDCELRFEIVKTEELLAFCANTVLLTNEAVPHMTEAVTLLKKLAAEHPDRLEYAEELAKVQTQRASCLMILARYKDAEAAFEEALAVHRKVVVITPVVPQRIQQMAGTYNGYALLVREAGDYIRAIEMIREVIRLLSQLKTEYPDKPEYWYQLPMAYRNLAQPLGYLNNTAEVSMAEREALRLEGELSRFPEASRKWVTDETKVLGSLHTTDISRLADQQPETDRLLRQAEQLKKDHPDVGLYQEIVLRANFFAGLRGLAGGEKENGLSKLREGMELAAKLAGQFPDFPKFGEMQAEAVQMYGLSLILCGQRSDGDLYLQQGFAVRERLARQHPDLPEIRNHYSQQLLVIAMTFKNQGERDAALKYLSQSDEVIKQLAKAFPACPYFRRHTAQAPITMAEELKSQGSDAEAEIAYREGICLWRQVIVDFPGRPEFRQFMALALRALGAFLAGKGRCQEAGAVYQEVIHIHEQLASEYPGEPHYQVSLAADYAWYGQLLERENQLSLAVENYTKTIELTAAGMKANPRQREWVSNLRLTYLQRAHDYLKLGKREQYEADMKRARDLEGRLDPPLVRIFRINGQLAGGQLAAAMQEANDLYQNADLTASDSHELAGSYARASAASKDAHDKDTYAGRAVELLRKASDQGHINLTPLDKDAQFQALAGRADFKKLLADLPK